MFRRIYHLMYKEFLAVWRDKKSRFVLIGPPILQLFVFAFAATLDIKNVTLGVLDRDKGERAFELIQRFAFSKTFKHIIPLQTYQELEAFIDEEKGMAAICFDETFSKNIQERKVADMQCILNGRRSNTAQIILGYVSKIVEAYEKEILQENNKNPKITIIDRNWFNPNLIYNWFTLPGLLVILTMLEALMIVSLSLAREKELGTFDQLLVSPLESTEILLGKTLPAVIIAVLEGSVILIASLLFFKLPFEGSLFLLYISMIVYILSIIGYGLFLAALCSTQQQAVLGVFIFMTPAILLSGFASPIENMPNWLQMITYIDPARYFLKISRGIFMKGLPATIIVEQILPMTLIAAVMLSSATLFFRKRWS